MISAGISQCSTLSLLHINDLPKNIVRSLVSFSADDWSVYRCSARNLEYQNVAAHQSSYPAQVAQLQEGLVCKIDTIKTKLVTFHSYRADCDVSNIMMASFSLEEAHCLKRLLRLELSTEIVSSNIRFIVKDIGSLYPSSNIWRLPL